MKILQITKYFYPNQGGIESNVLGISQELVKRGEEVTVIAANWPRTRKVENYQGIRIRRSSLLFTFSKDPFTPGMLIDLMREDYELIHLHLPDPFNSVFAYLASVLRRKPLVVTYHADIIKERWYHKPFTFLYSFLQSLILKKTAAIIATSPNYAKESSILRKFEFWEKMEVVPNFINAEKFNPRNVGRRVEKYSKLKDGKPMILFLGRLVPYKGVRYLIRAFPEVKKKIKNCRLIIAGRGPLKEELLEESRDQADIFFIEPRDRELPYLYSLSDVFVLPSVTRQEAFGITLLEAMGLEKPCISTNISGMPYVIGESGLVVPPGDSQALSEALIRLLSDKKLNRELGKKARRRVENRFTREKAVDKLLEIYKKCL